MCWVGAKCAIVIRKNLLPDYNRVVYAGNNSHYKKIVSFYGVKPIMAKKTVYIRKFKKIKTVLRPAQRNKCSNMPHRPDMQAIKTL